MEERLVSPFESNKHNRWFKQHGLWKQVPFLAVVGALTGIVLGSMITFLVVRPQVLSGLVGPLTGTINNFSKIFFASPVEGGRIKGIAATRSVNADKYHAVFLTNNQVYFGKLVAYDSDMPILRDVYYLRVQQDLQESSNPEESESKAQGKKKAAPTSLPSSEMTLIKLGNELHAPVDEIRLNRDHILFVEELKEDSRVVQAIRDYQKRQDQ